MNTFDLDNLKRDEKQDELYNLFDETFILREVPTLSTVVTREQEMRIDLISKDIYGTVDYADLLCNLNNITLPLNIMEGDTILYIETDVIDNYRVTIDDTQTKRRILLSPDKANIKDPNRQTFIENNYQLPPTFLNTPENSVTSQGNRITVSPLR